MANLKRIYIRTVTVERYLMSNDGANPIWMFCKACGHSTEMLTMQRASIETGVSMRNLFRLSEDHLIHSTETDTGQIMLCRKSINSPHQGGIASTEPKEL